MHPLPAIVALVFASTCLLGAQEQEQPASATSPNKAFRVINISPKPTANSVIPAHFEILNSAGETFYAAQNLDALDGAFSMQADRVRWSPDSKSVAVSVQTGRHTATTFVFHVADSHVTPIELPEIDRGQHELGAYCHPDTWLDSRRLKLSISWGTRRGDAWQYYVVVLLAAKPAIAREIERTKTVKTTQ